MTFKSVRSETDEIIDFEWTFTNDIASDMVGIPSDKLIGSRLLQLMPGNEEVGLFDKYKEVVKTGKFSTFEQYYPGEEVNKWFRVSAVKLNDGFTVTFQDVSDLKQAVMEVETRGKKYRKLFEESIDPIFLANDQLVFIDTNLAFQRLFVYAEDELVCMSLEGLFADRGHFNLFQKKFLEQGKVEEFETILLDKEGRKKDCLINCARLEDEETREKSFIGVVRDLTKRKRADRELLVAEKLSMTGKISRTIAHEVRNPLTNLTLAMEQLKEEIPEDVEDAELYFDIIKRNANRIGKLISDLLDSSKPKELKLETQPLNQTVKDALNLVRDRINLLNMTLKEEYEADLPDISLDADQLKVALLNLMINAIEAMKKGKGILTIKTYSEDGYLHLEIIDNGKGISIENLEKLFEPFYTSKEEGTGLGLVTVQNIIQSHKGEIKAESEDGKGTTFKINFPV
ncbi:MAG: ATP-binding protein [Ekhidna sp.]